MLSYYFLFCHVRNELPLSGLAAYVLYTDLFHWNAEITRCSKATKMLQKQWGRSMTSKGAKISWKTWKGASCQWGSEETFTFAHLLNVKGEQGSESLKYKGYMSLPWEKAQVSNALSMRRRGRSRRLCRECLVQRRGRGRHVIPLLFTTPDWESLPSHLTGPQPSCS